MQSLNIQSIVSEVNAIASECWCVLKGHQWFTYFDGFRVQFRYCSRCKAREDLT